MKYILHIDTSGDQCNVFIAKNGNILSQKISSDVKNHASVINFFIADVLELAGVVLKDLNAVSVIGGPGSYTGLRIGLATAKGLCYVNNLPLIMHHKLDLMAQQTLTSFPEIDNCLAILAAREHEYFITLQSKEAISIVPKHIEESELKSIFHQLDPLTSIITGEIGTFTNDISHSRNIQINENSIIDIDFWSQKSLEMLNCNRTVNLANAEPFYLKSVYINKSL